MKYLIPLLLLSTVAYSQETKCGPASAVYEILNKQYEKSNLRISINGIFSKL